MNSKTSSFRNYSDCSLHALLKKMTPERKGITFVTSFGRQKSFWLEMYHLHMLYRLFKKVAAKQQCFAFLGKMHDLGLGKGLWKESMHFFPTCLNCSERWYRLSKMEDGQDFPRKGLNCKFKGNTFLDDAIKECNSSFSTMSHLFLSNELPLCLKWIQLILDWITFLIGMKKPPSE